MESPGGSNSQPERPVSVGPPHRKLEVGSGMNGGMANEGVLDTLEKAVHSQDASLLDLRCGAAKDAMGSALLETDVGEVCRSRMFKVGMSGAELTESVRRGLISSHDQTHKGPSSGDVCESTPGSNGNQYGVKGSDNMRSNGLDSMSFDVYGEDQLLPVWSLDSAGEKIERSINRLR